MNSERYGATVEITVWSRFISCFFYITVENNSESLRKELTDVRRQLADSNFEKEKYHTSNKELRDHIKRVESEKREITRQLEETFQKITGNFLASLLLQVCARNLFALQCLKKTNYL